ncbi:uncharacterized protein LOC110113930 isoform X3 [Dendrobium catenatum]|uniref:uncharacterized protein LOC110113930 isoform X3 n=1 Tax=Dendrobium catenatum TaxID=906689 RepID=UPI0009F38728|nr:uncharacterized protein LOC110113930 isoform X3 [Dendrobium catenatum]
MESPRSGSDSESPCWKKKSAEEGLLAGVKDHVDQFVHTSVEQHRICLKKTIRGLSDFVKLHKSRTVKKERRFEGIETNREIAALFCLEELKLRNPNEMEMKIVKEFN